MRIKDITFLRRQNKYSLQSHHWRLEDREERSSGTTTNVTMLRNTTSFLPPLIPSKTTHDYARAQTRSRFYTAYPLVVVVVVV